MRCGDTLTCVALTDAHNRTRGYSYNSRECFTVPPRFYIKALVNFLCLVSRCVAVDRCLVVLCSPLAPAEQYLQSPLQLEHACDTIIDSELFAFHSERMCEILTDEVVVVSCAAYYIPAHSTN